MKPLLKVRNLKVYFKSTYGIYEVVDSVSFDVPKNVIFGLAGESGCGKSTLVDGILGLIDKPGYIPSGEVLFEGTDLRDLSEKEFREIRWKKIAYVPQGSMKSLNPVIKIKEQMIDCVKAHVKMPKEKLKKKVPSALKRVGLPKKVADMYSHELSGGMKQRVVIAMATILEPILLVADEPVTALDVVSSRINLQTLARLKEKFGMTIILVAHDMAVHAEISDRLAIMYAGKLAEIGSIEDIYKKSVHPYTKNLLKSIITMERKRAKSIPGISPSSLNWPSGCRFHPRCPQAKSICKKKEPKMVKVGPQHYAACHLLS